MLRTELESEKLRLKHRLLVGMLVKCVRSRL